MVAGVPDGHGQSGSGMDPSAMALILKQADQARGNRAGITWEVTIMSGGSRERTPMVFDVRARGFDTLATAISPAKDKGNKVLMVNGNMWFYKPGLSKPVPISARQKLMGNASYGDIAATNYFEDYDAALLHEETIDNEPCHVFDLTAGTKTATYDRIRYWISISRKVGLRADYFTVSGKKIKTARMFYQETVEMDGEEKPFISEIRISDTVTTSDQTVLKFENPQLAALPDSLFNQNLLKR
jgi:hypothetical protein